MGLAAGKMGRRGTMTRQQVRELSGGIGSCATGLSALLLLLFAPLYRVAIVKPNVEVHFEYRSVVEDVGGLGNLAHFQPDLVAILLLSALCLLLIAGGSWLHSMMHSAGGPAFVWIGAGLWCFFAFWLTTHEYIFREFFAFLLPSLVLGVLASLTVVISPNRRTA
jgi:hypothetical protein